MRVAGMIGDCSTAGIELSSSQAEKIQEFISILLERSGRINLIGPGEMERIWPRHCLESLCYSLLLDSSRRVADIGSGAGFPGIPLAILGMDVTMIEPRRKRALFLQHCKRELNLTGAMVINERLEEIEDELLPDQFTVRAVAPPEEILPVIRRKVRCPLLVCRQPGDWIPEAGLSSFRMPCPPLDRPGFVVQYQTCPDRTP